MDEPIDQPANDGIYTECPVCGALVANQGTHDAWHASREEEVSDAHAERS
ncbi:hypothetical protein [Microbacterium sp. NPDC089696]